jgi:hypothetical protein
VASVDAGVAGGNGNRTATTLHKQFDGLGGVRNLNKLLADAGSTMEECDSLLEVLLPS